MLTRLLITGVVSAVLVAASGCKCCPLGPCGHGCLFGPGACDGGCGACAPACGDCGTCDSCAACEAGCGEAGYGLCRPLYHGPLTWLFAIFEYGYCDSGCGETYWGEFHSDPPDCCDPCDNCGNYIGPSPGLVPGGSPVDGAGVEVPAGGGCNCGTASHLPEARAVAQSGQHGAVPQGTYAVQPRRASNNPRGAYAALSRRPSGAMPASHMVPSGRMSVASPQGFAANQTAPAPQGSPVVFQRLVSQTDRVLSPAEAQAQPRWIAAQPPMADAPQGTAIR